jgi:hypothetical protein
MSGKRVTFVELSVYDNTVPLVSGYLQAYASRDPLIAEAFDFDVYSRGVHADLCAVAGKLAERGSCVFALSCYIWNAGAIRRILTELLRALPDAYYILGGPQVMNRAHEVLPEQGHVVVCNGEGEQTFHEFLSQVATGAPDLRQVPGVSFRSGDAIVTTGRAPRLSSLDDLPSPFAAGIFDGGDYTFAVLETNRGCPYDCGFCFWGAATNSKVYRFADDRVRADIRWIAEHCVSSIFIADANWGLSPRDVELSRYIARCRSELGFPMSLTLAAAKNNPRRVAEITQILVRGGLVTSQPISLQTMSPAALRLVGRENINPETYAELQRTLDERGISSFVELIWPLPGETLDTYRQGIAQLCRGGADTLTIYPQLLLPNTALHERRETLGIEVIRAPDPHAEADVVVATKWVSRAECELGTWFHYAVQVLYNARAAYHLARYLDQRGLQSYEQFFSAAAQYFHRAGDAVSQFIASSVYTADNYDLLNMGKLAYLVLYAERHTVDLLLYEFAVDQPWWSDPGARCALDLDVIGRPYLYDEPVRLPAVEPAVVRWAGESASAATVWLPDDLFALPALRVHHSNRAKMPVPRLRSAAENAGYCHVMVQRIRMLLPTWTPVAAGRGAPAARGESRQIGGWHDRRHLSR